MDASAIFWGSFLLFLVFVMPHIMQALDLKWDRERARIKEREATSEIEKTQYRMMEKEQELMHQYGVPAAKQVRFKL